MKKLITIVLAAFTVSGCLAPKSFLDPKYRGVTYQDIRVPSKADAVNLTVVGERNGKELPKASEYWKRQVERVIRASRVFDLDRMPADSALKITINNVADLGTAAGKGFLTGFTFGAVGSLVTDGYIMTVEYRDASGKTFSKTYQHAIYTTIGNASPPEGISPVTPGEAPTLVAEDMILHFLKDLQSQEKTP